MDSAFGTLVIVIGLVGGLLSIISFVFGPWLHQRRILIPLFVLISVALTAIVTQQATYLSRLNSISRQADELTETRRMHYTSLGYSLAALAFLEKNRDLFPDAYARAQTLCEQYSCTSPEGSNNAVDLSHALNGLVKGLGSLSD